MAKPAPITPMMQQYLSIKARYKDAVLFFRLGDFYEMFNDDAIEVSKLLNLTLTQRTGSPMCGIPYHASRIYIARLLRAGKKVAICEQVSDVVPGELTERKIVEVITPGTATGDDFLEQGQNNYLAAVYCTPKEITYNGVTDVFIGFAYLDVSTGEFFATSFPRSDFAEQFKKELGRVQPREILIQISLADSVPALKALCGEYPQMLQNLYPDWHFSTASAEKRLCACFGTESLKSFGLTAPSPELPPAGLLLQYLDQTTGAALPHITGIKVYRDSDFVMMDDATRKNLELLQNLHDSTDAFTLFETVNYTKTAMGTRLLRQWLYHPLRTAEEINARLNKTVVLFRNEKALAAVRTTLAAVLDIRRLTGRVAMQRAHGKDLLGIKQSLKACIELVHLSRINSLFFLQLPQELHDDMEGLYTLLDKSIAEDCPIALTEGGLIKQGWSEKLDELRDMRDNANKLLEAYLEKEREKSGIKNLKIKYNRLSGYFLEVTRGTLKTVEIPKHFIRRRSLTTADRFTTDDLSKLETKLNDVGENIIACEKELFLAVHTEVYNRIGLLHLLAKEIAELDVLQSFAYAAALHAWVKPEFSADGLLDIREGRHPVVENHLPAGEFVPNSIKLSSAADADIPSFALITGPNMAGKSTFLRQTALIVLLAQVGSFVPAEKALLTPVDCIFCRVGASDNLARGESTFLVEMTETAYILRNASVNSLVIMDEIGRGTSTGDGFSIARAVSEYLLQTIGAKTLFATHYHELAQLIHPRLQRLCLDVAETEGKIVFLKKVIEGIAAHSYGVHVAELAGLPETVIRRATELLNTQVSGTAVSTDFTVPEKKSPSPEKNLFSDEELIINEILSTDTDGTTPLQALQMISRWKKTLLPQN
ncbi:DNA mismatch repair protein MutS [Treponema vincentii]|uniref:DNA mismatch repair protein MutS n=1 Tax=Treponema vincentii TaxID=69710 RepID=UPI0020A4A554|nr:DNA mismatch repair protein MutS [Treponema vincentii]